jgi:iron complex outermembrane receptor protein
MRNVIRTACQRRAPSRLVVLALCLVVPMVAAQGDTANDNQGQMALEEIIVTARKREESLQETPVAISAFSAEALEVAGIANTRDLQESVPGLIFSEQGNKAPSIFIRGIGQKEANAALDPGVGVYINSIYIARTDSQLLDVIDTESIQVLRGPQGTLFGKNNTGGALLINTIVPHTDALEGEVSTRLGNYGRRDVKVSGNVPGWMATRRALTTAKNTATRTDSAEQDGCTGKPVTCSVPTFFITARK